MKLVFCALLVTSVRAGSSSKSVTAQIQATVMDQNTKAPVNSSYYFGVYGSSSLQIPVTGHLVHVRSQGNVNHGCTDYNHDLPDHDWVALIERGECMFSEKIRVATKQNNASAVIVYDNRETGPNLVSMQSNVKDEVYLFVKRQFGRRLALLTDSGLHVHVNITPLDLSNSASTVATVFSLPLLVVYCLTMVMGTTKVYM